MILTSLVYSSHLSPVVQLQSIQTSPCVCGCYVFQQLSMKKPFAQLTRNPQTYFNKKSTNIFPTWDHMHAITILNHTLNKYNQHSSSGCQHMTEVTEPTINQNHRCYLHQCLLNIKHSVLPVLLLNILGLC